MAGSKEAYEKVAELTGLDYSEVEEICLAQKNKHRKLLRKYCPEKLVESNFSHVVNVFSR